MAANIAAPPEKIDSAPLAHDPASQVSESTPHSHHLDWLRAIAVVIVLAYHSILLFARSTRVPSNAELSDALLAVVLLFPPTPG